MSAVSTEHIHVDEHGVARIIGSRIKVIHLVMDRMANGWSADEIHQQHPHLTLADVHAAFAYYYDHQQELDERIRQSLKNVEDWKRQFPVPDLAKRIRADREEP